MVLKLRRARYALNVSQMAASHCPPKSHFAERKGKATLTNEVFAQFSVDTEISRLQKAMQGEMRRS